MAAFFQGNAPAEKEFAVSSPQMWTGVSQQGQTTRALRIGVAGGWVWGIPKNLNGLETWKLDMKQVIAEPIL